MTDRNGKEIKVGSIVRFVDKDIPMYLNKIGIVIKIENGYFDRTVITNFFKKECIGYYGRRFEVICE